MGLWGLQRCAWACLSLQSARHMPLGLVGRVKCALLSPLESLLRGPLPRVYMPCARVVLRAVNDGPAVEARPQRG